MYKKNILFFIYFFSCFAMENDDICVQIRKLCEIMAVQSTDASIKLPDDIASLRSVIHELRETLKERETLLETAYTAMQTFTRELQQKELLLFETQQEKSKQQEMLERLSKKLIEMDAELSGIKHEYKDYADSIQNIICERRAAWERMKHEKQNQ